MKRCSSFWFHATRQLRSQQRAIFVEHKEERIAIPLCFGDLDDPQATAWTVRNAIQRHYLTLDRFRYTLLLQEDTYFFGRQREIGHLLDACKRGENAGLFGLRKTGKTSLLFKFQRTVEREGFALCLYEEEEVEEVLDSPREDRPGRDGSRVAIGQTRRGRFLRVIYVHDPQPDSAFVVTAYDLRGKPLLAYR